MEQPFTSEYELLDNLRRGGEVEFDYDGKSYFIGRVADETYAVYEKDNEQSVQSFATPEEACSCRIGGERTADVVLKAEITFRCFE